MWVVECARVGLERNQKDMQAVSIAQEEVLDVDEVLLIWLKIGNPYRLVRPESIPSPPRFLPRAAVSLEIQLMRRQPSH